MRNAPTLTTLTGSEFEIQSIQYNLTADAVLGDMYIPPGTGVREQLTEPEGMLTPNWDIRYEGLMDTGVTLVRIDAAGNDEYDMEYTNQEGIFFDFPLVSNELGNAAGTFKYGDNDDDLWFQEFCLVGAGIVCAPFTTAAGLTAVGAYINDDDFFVVSNCNVPTQKNTCFSHVLRYDNIDVTNRQLTFTDLGTGTREVSYDSATFLAELVVGGVTYRVGVANAVGVVVAPGNLVIDLNADGAIVNCTEAIIGIQGEGLIDLGRELTPTVVLNNASVPANESWCPTNTTSPQTWANVTLRTMQKEFDEAGVDEVIQINVTQRLNNEVGINDVLALSGIYFSGLVDLEENNDIEQALSGYGVFFELFNPQNGEEAEDLTIEYPLSQRGARVFVTGGVVSTTSIAGGGVERVQPIQIGAAKLATEVSDVSMYNAIVVGGPCANPIAATLLGNPEPCYESVGQNEAIVKLFEHSNGNVALLVNGRTALNTRMGARAIATGEIIKAASKEAKVTGPKLTEITVSAV